MKAAAELLLDQHQRKRGEHTLRKHLIIALACSSCHMAVNLFLQLDRHRRQQNERALCKHTVFVV